MQTTTLAETMDVSPPAVARMVKRLDGLGLLEHLPYQGVKLTPSGNHEAMLGIRRHRLVERFLVDVLGFGWHEVHDEADQMQGGVNQKMRIVSTTYWAIPPAARTESRSPAATG